jgi:hypothetical protein
MFGEDDENCRETAERREAASLAGGTNSECEKLWGLVLNSPNAPVKDGIGTGLYIVIDRCIWRTFVFTK